MCLLQSNTTGTFLRLISNLNLLLVHWWYHAWPPKCQPIKLMPEFSSQNWRYVWSKNFEFFKASLNIQENFDMAPDFVNTHYTSYADTQKINSPSCILLHQQEMTTRLEHSWCNRWNHVLTVLWYWEKLLVIENVFQNQWVHLVSRGVHKIQYLQASITLCFLYSCRKSSSLWMAVGYR